MRSVSKFFNKHEIDLKPKNSIEDFKRNAIELIENLEKKTELALLSMAYKNSQALKRSSSRKYNFS